MNKIIIELIETSRSVLLIPIIILLISMFFNNNFFDFTPNERFIMLYIFLCVGFVFTKIIENGKKKS